jgi:hypothetical protein
MRNVISNQVNQMTARARNKAGVTQAGVHQHRSKSTTIQSNIGIKSYATKMSQFVPRPEHDAGPESGSVGPSMSVGIPSSAANTLAAAASFLPQLKADRMGSPKSTMEAFTGVPLNLTHAKSMMAIADPKGDSFIGNKGGS